MRIDAVNASVLVTHERLPNIRDLACLDQPAIEAMAQVVKAIVTVELGFPLCGIPRCLQVSQGNSPIDEDEAGGQLRESEEIEEPLGEGNLTALAFRLSCPSSVIRLTDAQSWRR